VDFFIASGDCRNALDCKINQQKGKQNFNRTDQPALMIVVQQEEMGKMESHFKVQIFFSKRVIALHSNAGYEVQYFTSLFWNQTGKTRKRR
jgi:hypothetical protein